MASDDASHSVRTALAQLSLASNMASDTATPKANETSATPVTNEELLAQLKKEVSENLSPWENEFIDRQSRMSIDLLQMSAKASDIRESLLALTTSLELQMVQYALIKHHEMENYKAQIETYKAEVDLLRQENYELATEQEDTPTVEAKVNGSDT